MEIRGVRIPRHKNIRIKKQDIGSDSLVIVQWSCDPPPENEVDTLLETRNAVDKIGKKNADKFFKSMPKRKHKLSGFSDGLNEDFTIIREGSKTAQKFYEVSNTAQIKQNTTRKSSQTVTSLRSTFNTADFKNALFNGNIIFLPIHAGHILDEEGDTVKQVVLPEKTYVVSFNPPNTNMLFLDRELAYEFLNYIIKRYLMESVLHNSKLRGKEFEKSLIENFRVWGPSNTVINRGLQLDRDVDILFKPYNKDEFEVTRGISKAALRMEANKTIYDLYPKIIQQMKLTRESTTGRGTRKKRKPNKLIKSFKKLKKTLSSNKKFKITLKQKPLL
jgi:hypothetical protein